MAERKEYYIRVQSTLVVVTKEVYKAYYGAKRHEKVLSEKDERHGLVSYNALDNADTIGENMIPDDDALSIEDVVISRILSESLHRCLALLPKADQELISALYFEGLSERQLAEKSHTPQRTIHDRKVKVLRKLKKMMNS